MADLDRIVGDLLDQARASARIAQVSEDGFIEAFGADAMVMPEGVQDLGPLDIRRRPGEAILARRVLVAGRCLQVVMVLEPET